MRVGGGEGLRGSVRAVAGPASAPRLTVEAEDGTTLEADAADCPLQNGRDDTLDDLVKADFLHEPG